MLLDSKSKANEILENSYRYISSLPRFSFEATTINEDVYNNMVVEVKHKTKVKLKRGARFRIDIEGDTKNRVYYLYGEHLINYDKSI
jgi:hypothetical protein